MPQYDYKCDVCGHEYMEFRDESHPLWKPSCVKEGCTGNNVLVTPEAPTA